MRNAGRTKQTVQRYVSPSPSCVLNNPGSDEERKISCKSADPENRVSYSQLGSEVQILNPTSRLSPCSATYFCGACSAMVKGVAFPCANPLQGIGLPYCSKGSDFDAQLLFVRTLAKRIPLYTSLSSTVGDFKEQFPLKGDAIWGPCFGYFH